VTVGGALCVCGDTQEEHRRGTGGCREPECGCGRFEPTGSYAAEPAGPVLDVAALLAEAQGDADREAELTARLAEVERERDSLLAHNGELVDVSRERDDARGELATLRNNILAVRAEMDERHQERDAARWALKKVGEQRDELAAKVAELNQALANTAQAYIATTSNVLHSYDAWLCATCGRRYTRDTAAVDHACGPMQPVTVTVSRRPAQDTTTENRSTTE